MTQQTINIGAAPDDHTGDPVRTAFDKTNQNFTELYAKPSGGGGDTSGLVSKSGDTMTGPLAINTMTSPMLTIGWPQDTTLMQFGVNTITLNGNGGPAPAISNKTYLTVNGVGFGHKSYQAGNTPIWLSQSNQGEFYIALGNGAPVAFSDMKNGHPVRVSYDAGNAIVYGSDGAIFVPHGAMTMRGLLSLPVRDEPEAPADGDVWMQDDGLYFRIKGVTKKVTAV